jgi:hypothetical protein
MVIPFFSETPDPAQTPDGVSSDAVLVPLGMQIPPMDFP